MEKQVESKEVEKKEASDHQKKMTQQLSRPKGGFRTMPFIIANEAFEKVASYGLLPNMIMYLMKEYHMDSASGSSVLFFWSALTNFLPLLGALLSDSYMGRFRTIAFGSTISFLGMSLLWLTSIIPQARPPKCNLFSPSCKSATASQLGLLYFSFVIMSIGAGGIRPCSMPFGADQFDNRDNPENKKVLERFFSWYYASATFSIVIALTVIVYIQDHLGWKVGFGVPVILMFLSAFLFLSASSSYIKMKADKSLVTGFARVPVAAFKNRHLAFPSENTSRQYHNKKDSKFINPTDKLRFLNKACIIRNPENDLNPDGSASKPWSLCTVDQVEDMKSLIKVIPLWSTGIVIAVTISQNSFPLLQANSMDRHITSHFQFPAGSFGLFTITTIVIWIIIYDRIILPLVAKISGKPRSLGVKQRMGIGLLLSCMAMVVSAIIESVRRRTAIQQGLSNNPRALVGMSAMWLVPQHCLTGLAEAFYGIAQIEFYYSQLPKSMSSIAGSLFGLGMAIGNLVASLIVNIVDNSTKRGGKESWVSSNINKAHYDYYYWVIAILGLCNFLYFLVCCWVYGPNKEEGKRVLDLDEGEGKKEEDLSKSTELAIITST